MSEPILEVTLAFSRKNAEDDWEDFSNSFTSDESLGPILEKMELFLQQIGFVTDGKMLDLIEKVVDSPIETSYNNNITAFPTPFIQE